MYMIVNYLNGLLRIQLMSLPIEGKLSPYSG